MKATPRRILTQILFAKCQPIIIASTGRSGSTMLFDAVAESFVRNRFGSLQNIPFIKMWLIALSKCFIDRLSDINYSPAPIKKTHALYRDRYRHNAMYIFVYGPPWASAISVNHIVKEYGIEWLDEHLYHLESEGSWDQLFTHDILRYEDQLKSWGNTDKDNVVCIHYSQLWDSEILLSSFLGFEVKLPPKRDRTTKLEPGDYNAALFERLSTLESKLLKMGK